MSKDRESRFFGWTQDQWSHVIARLDAEHPRSISDSLAIRKEWKRQFLFEPLEIQLQDVPPVFDHEGGLQAFVTGMPS